jgi:head-tail adaptor
MKCENICFRKEAKHKIIIQSLTETVSAIGTPITSWSNLLELFAIIKASNKLTENLNSGRLLNTLVYSIVIRYQSNLSANQTTGKYKVVFGSKTMNILGIKNLYKDLKTEGKDYQELVCVEGELA